MFSYIHINNSFWYLLDFYFGTCVLLYPTGNNIFRLFTLGQTCNHKIILKVVVKNLTVKNELLFTWQKTYLWF